GRFPVSNSVSFSDTFCVRTVLAISARAAPPIGPALVHQRRAAWTVRVVVARNRAVRSGHSKQCSRAPPPSLGFGFDARLSLRPRSLGGDLRAAFRIIWRRPSDGPHAERLSCVCARGGPSADQ